MHQEEESAKNLTELLTLEAKVNNLPQSPILPQLNYISA